AAAAMVVGYAVLAYAQGFFDLSTKAPVSHSDVLWNVLALMLVGLTGALAGGCPVRQLVMAGEGNGDAFVTVAGLVVGGALAHQYGLVSSTAGPTEMGKMAVAAGLVLALGYGLAMTRRGPAPALAERG